MQYGLSVLNILHNKNKTKTNPIKTAFDWISWIEVEFKMKMIGW